MSASTDSKQPRPPTPPPRLPDSHAPLPARVSSVFDRDSQLSSTSDAGSIPPDSLAAASDQLIRDYVVANLLNPTESFSNAHSRATFANALLGDTSLAKHAEDDAPLLRQLETRVSVLIAEATPVLATALHTDADAVIALFSLIAAKWPILLNAMESKDVIKLVVSTMRHWSHKPTVVARCMTALRVFAVTDSVRKRVMCDGGLNLTLDLMSHYRNDHRVQDRAAAVIANVAFGCTHRKRRIARQGGVRKIIEGMSAFPYDENIQLRGALTIRNLTHEAQVNQYIAGNEGAVEAIASTLLRFRGSSTNPELRFQCVMALESLCREDERNRQRIVDIDNIPVLIPKSHSSTSVPVSKIAEDLQELTNEDGDVIVDEEEILLPYLSANFRHGGALFPGRTRSMLASSASFSSNLAAENPPAVWRQEESKHPNDDASTDTKVTPKIPEQKPSLIRAIMHAMRRDPDDALLLETALSLLTLISLHRADVQRRIGELGGIQVAIATIRRHPDNAGIAAKACALIRGLCFQEANRVQATSGLLVLIAAAQAHIKDPHTVPEVLSSISNVVFENEKNRAWAVSKGAIEIVVNSMRECADKDVMVLEAALCALRNLMTSSPSTALCAAKEGAVQAAVAALDVTREASSSGQRIVQEQAVWFLVEISHLAPHTKDEMKELDAADWIENALAKLSVLEFADLHAAGDNLINVLNADARGKFSGGKSKSDATAPPSPTAVTEKPQSRGFFGAFLFPRRAPAKGLLNGRKRQVSNGSASTGPTSHRRSRRISSRFLKGSAVS